MAFFEHAHINSYCRCNIVKTCILGIMSGKRRRGSLGCSTLITHRQSDMEEHGWKIMLCPWSASCRHKKKKTERVTDGRKRNGTAAAADVKTDDTVHNKVSKL